MPETICERNINVVPGWKLCRNCLNRIQEWKTDSEQIDQHDEIVAEMISLEEYADKSITRNNLDESFESVGISPLKFLGIPSHSEILVRKNKIKECMIPR